MFYYVSFVRPPPTTCSPSERGVTISVQIANDLRTLVCHQPYSIYYSWFSPSTKSTTPPAKLTTWNPGVEYKSLDVPFPVLPSRGQAQNISLRLILWATPTSAPTPKRTIESTFVDILIGLEGFGSHPFPVISMPISIAAPPKGSKSKIVKQEQIERYFLLPKPSTVEGTEDDDATHELGRLQRRLVVREQTSYDLDKKLWDSGLGLFSWLSELLYPTAYNTVMSSTSHIAPLRNILLSSDGFNAIELGTGTGLVGLGLAALLQPLLPSAIPRKILVTDLPSAIPLIKQNITTNQLLYPSTDLTSGVLDWDDLEAISLERFPQGVDLIIMADVCYNTDSFPALVSTLERLFNLTKKPPMVLMAYKERDPGEREIFKMCATKRIVLEQVGSIEGAGEEAIEIYIGTR